MINFVPFHAFVMVRPKLPAHSEEHNDFLLPYKQYTKTA